MNYTDLARKNILNLTPYQPGRLIEDIKREFSLNEVIKLASNENPLGTSKTAIAAIETALTEIYRYQDGECRYLKNKLAESLNLNPSNLIIGNGSDEVIKLIVETFMEQEDEAITSAPSFLEYKIIVESSGTRCVEVPLKNFNYDLKAINSAITARTKIIFFANPNNPTGTYLAAESLDKFLKEIDKRIIVVIDEAYYEFAEEDNYTSALKYIQSNNVLILRTFSKAFGLAGLRIGYGAADEEAISLMNRVRQPFNVNSLAQAAAIGALEDKDYLHRTKEIISKGKDYLYGQFERLGLNYVRSAANFILIDMKKSANELCGALLKKGVIVRDMTAYNLPAYIRVTIGRKEENEKFIEELGRLI